MYIILVRKLWEGFLLSIVLNDDDFNDHRV